MSEVLLREILAAQADDLVRGGVVKRTGDYLDIFPSQAEELRPLLEVAEQTSRLLSRRVEPDAVFREELHRSLLAQARQQQALGASGFVIPRRWILGAAAVGSAVSVAGLVAYFIRQRQFLTMMESE